MDAKYTDSFFPCTDDTRRTDYSWQNSAYRQKIPPGVLGGIHPGHDRKGTQGPRGNRSGRGIHDLPRCHRKFTWAIYRNPPTASCGPRAPHAGMEHRPRCDSVFALNDCSGPKRQGHANSWIHEQRFLDDILATGQRITDPGVISAVVIAGLCSNKRRRR